MFNVFENIVIPRFEH